MRKQNFKEQAKKSFPMVHNEFNIVSNICANTVSINAFRCTSSLDGGLKYQ